MAAPARKKMSKMMTICGEVIPNEWDEDYELTGFVIEKVDGNRIIVDPDGELIELLPYVGQWIEATGAVYLDDGQPYIVIQSFRPTDRPNSVDDDEA